jgi:hypothetical protein
MSLKMTDYNAAFAAYTAARNAACDAWAAAQRPYFYALNVGDNSDPSGANAPASPPPASNVSCPDSFPDFLTWCLANGYSSDMNESFGQ